MRRNFAQHRPVPGDLVRAAAVASLVFGGATLGGVAGALFFLVLGGALVPRFLGVPAALDACFGACMLLAAWAALLGWYESIWWLDLLAHAVCTGLVAAVGVLALRRRLGEEPPPRRRGDSVALVVTTAGTGALAAVLWELGEWAGHTYLDRDIHVGYTDTISDLGLGLLGALLAGMVLAVGRARRAPGVTDRGRRSRGRPRPARKRVTAARPSQLLPTDR